MPAPITCTLVLLTATGVTQIPHLTLEDAQSKFWEYNKTQEYPDVAMEAIYCGKLLKLILNNSNTAAVDDGQYLDPNGNPAPPPTPQQ